jgi:hypothetical protein
MCPVAFELCFGQYSVKNMSTMLKPVIKKAPVALFSRTICKKGTLMKQ